MTKLTRTCPFCHKTYSMEFDSKALNEGMKAYNAGALLQDAFPSFTSFQREFIKTGICDACWDNM